MSTSTAPRATATDPTAVGPAPAWSLAAALLGFFMVTLDAVIVDVALPDIRHDLSSGISGLQWVADGYTLMFAALLIFFVNVPAGALALLLLARAARSPRHRAPFDWAGQAAAVAGMGGLTYGAIEAGAAGLTAPSVLAAFAIAVTGLAGFGIIQARSRHPMLPLSLFHSSTVSVAVATGFAFMVGYYGLPFVMSLHLQQLRGLSALGTGVVFLPMMLFGGLVTPFTARLAERFGPRALITVGLLSMTSGLAVIALLPGYTPVAALSALMILVGLAGPLVMPPVMALLLHAVPARQTGVASGAFNTSRQVGGALAIAVFGALLASRATFLPGLQLSLLIAAAVTLLAATTVVVLLPRPASRLREMTPV